MNEQIWMQPRHRRLIPSGPLCAANWSQADGPSHEGLRFAAEWDLECQIKARSRDYLPATCRVLFCNQLRRLQLHIADILHLDAFLGTVTVPHTPPSGLQVPSSPSATITLSVWPRCNEALWCRFLHFCLYVMLIQPPRVNAKESVTEKILNFCIFSDFADPPQTASNWFLTIPPARAESADRRCRVHLTRDGATIDDSTCSEYCS